MKAGTAKDQYRLSLSANASNTLDTTNRNCPKRMTSLQFRWRVREPVKPTAKDASGMGSLSKYQSQQDCKPQPKGYVVLTCARRLI